ncbi:AMP-binding protein [Cellulomonas sp. SLBN-39]|uniref:AMP-binding protein n=1 Tax=Cellulomonas sp. SLBN-39 TaxID=2768446 RepID=UPI00116773B3|nr:long-chain acyl-CoA synthetase [Cellulomonas sp. SLBN-39]
MTITPDAPVPAAWPHGVPREVDVPDEPLGATLERTVREHPARVAVDFLGRTTTWAQIGDQVSRGAAVLRDLGVGPGDRVALVLPNCTTHLVAFWAVLRLGAVVVEHNPTYTADELEHQLADSGATVAVVWEQAVPRVLAGRARTALRHVVAVDLSADLPTVSRLALGLPVPTARRTRAAMRGAVPAGVPHWHRLLRRARPLPEDVARPAGADVALIQYTGGTTGTPKGAVLTHRNLLANALQGQAWTQAEPGTEVVYAVLPFFHAFGLTLCLTYATRIGATLVVLPSFDPARVLAAQRRRPGTFLPAVPPMLDRLAAAAEESGADLTSFRYAISGAMALPRATAERWEKVTGGIVAEGYGMTETSPVALGNPLSRDRRPGSLGLPFPSTRIRVVDQEDPTRDVAPGERGELLIAGPQVFAGYWDRPEETAHQLLDGGWLRTGDVVQVEDDGFVVLLDRMKEMIVTGGFKVYPSQVEDHLRTMPGVRDVAVVGEPAGDMGERVVAAVVLDEGASGIDLAAVRAWCETRLARYAVPRRLVVLPDLPRSQVGKVLRRVVRDEVVAHAA